MEEVKKIIIAFSFVFITVGNAIATQIENQKVRNYIVSFSIELLAMIMFFGFI